MEKERGITIVNVEKEQAIRDIAWEYFQLKLGVRFKTTITAEDKKGIIEKEEFQYYIEEATKIYEKKQLAFQNKKYPVIDVRASGKSGWVGGAYMLCFVYSKYKSNFVLRGYNKEVEEYLKNYTHYFCYKSYWSHGFSRGHWDFWKKVLVFSNPIENEEKKRNLWLDHIVLILLMVIMNLVKKK